MTMTTVEWQFGDPDDEYLPIRRCACGALFDSWSMFISVYKDDPTEMPCCGRRVYFRQTIDVREVLPQDEGK